MYVPYVISQSRIRRGLTRFANMLVLTIPFSLLPLCRGAPPPQEPLSHLPAASLPRLHSALHTFSLWLSSTAVDRPSPRLAQLALSALALFLLLAHTAVLNGLHAYKRAKNGGGSRIFVSSTLGVFVVGLLVSALLQSLGGVLDAQWLADRNIDASALCPHVRH